MPAMQACGARFGGHFLLYFRFSRVPAPPAAALQANVFPYNIVTP
jgi:hypothetical protein